MAPRKGRSARFDGSRLAAPLLAMALGAAWMLGAETSAAQEASPGATDAGQTGPTRPDPEVTRKVAPGTPRPQKDTEPAWQREPRTRRSGFVVGISVAPAIGRAAGYPNDAKKIGREAFYTQTDVGIGGNFSLLIGGALADYLVFSFGGTGGTLTAGDHQALVGAVTFRTEVFPLWGLGGVWREVGVAVDAGTGTATVTDADDETLVDGGLASRVGGGAFYEGFRLWKLSMGPFAGGNYVFSQTVRRGEIAAGWRTVLYVGP